VSEIIVARNLARRTRPTTSGFMNAFFVISLIDPIGPRSKENYVFVAVRLLEKRDANSASITAKPTLRSNKNIRLQFIGEDAFYEI
jgi:hypothetical protein